MNIAHFLLCKLYSEGLFGHTPEDYFHYRDMVNISMRAVLKNCIGLDAIHLQLAEANSWNEMFYERFKSIRRLNEDGNNVLLVGVDCLMVRPSEVDWDVDHIVLRRLAGVDYETDEGIIIPADKFRAIGQAMFPSSIPYPLWEAGDNIWAGVFQSNYQVTPGEYDLHSRHDHEMYVYNKMYYNQGAEEFEHDPNPAMDCVVSDGPPVADPIFLHYGASRGPVETLRRMRDDAKRYGITP